jgi:thiamine-phosphate pyrophosphorylase
MEKLAFLAFAAEAIELCKQCEATLFLNSSLETAMSIGAEAVHLTSSRLMALDGQDINIPIDLGVSCHTQEELCKAADVGARFAVLSPVYKTGSHVNAEPLGWDKFSDLAEYAALPVYALGGMKVGVLSQALQHNAQGISGITGFYKPKTQID